MADVVQAEQVYQKLLERIERDDGVLVTAVCMVIEYQTLDGEGPYVAFGHDSTSPLWTRLGMVRMFEKTLEEGIEQR